MLSNTADRAGQTKFGSLDAWSEKLVRSQEVLVFFKELRDVGVGTGAIEGRMKKIERQRLNAKKFLLFRTMAPASTFHDLKSLVPFSLLHPLDAQTSPLILSIISPPHPLVI